MPFPPSQADAQAREASAARPTPSVPVMTVEEQLEASRRLLQALSRVHADFITHGDPHPIFEQLLALMVELTRSERGVISELQRPPDGPPSLQLHAVYAWPEASRDLEALMGSSLATGEPVLLPAPSESPANGPPDAAGRPFLGMPFKLQGELMGVVGLGLRPGGYEDFFVKFLEPVLTTCGTLLHAARKQREQQGTESAEGLRLALESVEDGLWDWDLRTNQLTVSPRWLSMLGYETTLKPTFEWWSQQLCHPEDLPEANRQLTEHREGLTPMYEFEHRLRHKDGHWMWVLGRAKVVARDEQGRALRMVGINSDISSRRRAQGNLQDFIQAIPDMIFRVRVDGMCLGFKPSALEPTFLSPEQLIGKNLFLMPLPEHLKTNLKAALQRVTQDSSLEIFEFSMEMPFGLHQYEARVVPSGSDEGTCVVRNITARKLVEEQRRRQQEELEERVRHATRELESRQAQLIQSEKLASLGQMAASIAHEINNPVGYVSSNVSTLGGYIGVLRRLIELYLRLEEELNPEARESVAGLLEQARALREQEHLDELLQDMNDLLSDTQEGTARIREFILDLKTFVREESGTLQQADVNKLLQVTLRMLRHELKHKVQVRLDFGPMPLVSCYPTQLNQVFMNLLLNAAQAIEPRGDIHITTRKEGSEAVVWIRDTGRGMSPETLERLFTPFFTTKPAGEGTGLGLSICYAIISRHKGRIQVDSELGKGTTFVVRLPLTE
jgi:PAS domain S-box-containing protein